MKRIFSSRNLPAADAFAAFAALSKRDFFDGEHECPDGTFSEVHVDQGIIDPVRIIHLSSGSDIAFRRGPQHIRRNPVGLRAIWFVRKGALKIVRANGTCEIGEGQVGIMDSSAPSHTIVSCKRGEQHESTMVLVPPDLFFSHLGEAEHLFVPVEQRAEGCKVCTRLLDILTTHGESMGKRTVRHLVDAFLEALADHLRGSEIEVPTRQNVVNRRLSEIENYIRLNLTDPNLCHDQVAVNCGISPRYLFQLLKANNTSFSDMVWKNRLPMARDWLASSGNRDQPIHEIAYKCGFKSAAHFSRMFKSAYGVPPREFRANILFGGSSPCASPDTRQPRAS